MIKGTNTLVFKFAVILGIFSIIMVSLSGVANYVIQSLNYKKVCEQNVKDVGEYLSSQIHLHPSDFVEYQEYYISHYNEVDIPYSFTECTTAKKYFDNLLSKEIEAGLYPDGWTVKELSPEAKKAWFIYQHEYWVLLFEQARKAFNLPYTYYLLMKDDIYNVVYMIDGERTVVQKNGKSYLFLGDEYYNDPKIYSIEWNTWFTGKKQSKCQIWNNEWGHTFAYYTPLIVDGRKLGLIGTEFYVSAVNKGIISYVIAHIITYTIILGFGVIVILVIVKRKYISKVEQLEHHVRKYSLTKNYKIAEKIESEIVGQTELSSLAKRISEMIIEIENYMRNAFTTQAENSSDYAAIQDNDFLRRDALTGIRGGVSFEKEMNRLETERKTGLKEFGFAFIDLNDLGKLNVDYGLDQGNIAIKKLCGIVCSVFAHSPVFRVGGDDFVAILYNEDYQNVKSLITTFNERLIQIDEKIEPWEDISAAIGVALYIPERDGNAESVLNRAELNMQNSKREMKSRLKL